MKFGVLQFPGSNCDHDCYHGVKHVLNEDCDFVWHKETSLKGYDGIFVPGGFSYGDYLRPGAIANFSPIMEELKKFADAGGPVIGICNGFQILCEAGLLPGVLTRNRDLKFICKNVTLKVENNNTIFTKKYQKDEVITIPIAHHDGNYFAQEDTIKEMEDNNQIVFRYSDSMGNVTDESNINGSINNIAGITNKKGNVLGMMPHPERALEDVVGKTDGLNLFKSLEEFLK